MIIIKMFGGIGNQMFQFALYKNLINSNIEVYIDDTSFMPSWDSEKVRIINIFQNVDYPQASKKMIELLGDVNVSTFDKIRRKLFHKKTHFKEQKFPFNHLMLSLEGNYYLEGFWQSEKYFYTIKDKVSNSFKFPDVMECKNKDIINKILQENSISIHIRKGPSYRRKIYEGVCESEYYRKCIEILRQKIDKPQFYIFSDNITWCRENLSFLKAIYIDWNPCVGNNCYLDMQLMSLCRHNIIANSSYSWWGAWLNRNPAKVVIGPERWFNSDSPKFDTRDIMPESWIRV
jgi:hypothetical protein